MANVAFSCASDGRSWQGSAWWEAGMQPFSCCAEWLCRQEAEGLACLLHAHHEAVVHCCAILLGALAQVVVQHLHNAQVSEDSPENRETEADATDTSLLDQMISLCGIFSITSKQGLGLYTCK